MLGGVAWPLEAADDSDGEPCPSGRVRVNRSDGEVFAPERTAGPSPRADAGNTMVVVVVVVVAPGGVVCVATALASATFVSERGTSTTAKRVGEAGECSHPTHPRMQTSMVRPQKPIAEEEQV